MATRAMAIEDAKTGEVTKAVYEHPLVVCLCHWANAVSLFVMVGSGFQIFRAFPSFGAKIPQKDLLDWPKSLALGGWLGGALQWHLTFMWVYIATGLVYLGYQIFSGNYKQVLFVRRDIPGVFLRPQTPDQGSLQPAAEACIHLRDWPGSAFGIDRHCNLEARAVFLAGVVDGRLPSGAAVAFPDHVGDAGVRVWAFGDGGASWLEQFRLHVDGMEKGPGIRL
jgi:Prokaryotic cytochrome b561